MKILISQFISKILLFSIKSVVVFILTLLLIFIGTSKIFDNQKKINQPQTFSITGTAHGDTIPDKAVIHMGTYMEGTDPATIQKEGNTKINKTINDIKKLGVNSKNIKTSNYSLTPVYTYETNVQKIDHYLLNIELEVQIDNIDISSKQVGDVIDIAFTNGLEQMRALDYKVSNREKLITQLKLKAIDNAKSKVAAIETKSGLRLGKILNVRFNSGNIYPQTVKAYRIDTVGTVPGSTTDTNVQTGKNSIQTSVTIIYEVL